MKNRLVLLLPFVLLSLVSCNNNSSSSDTDTSTTSDIITSSDTSSTSTGTSYPDPSNYYSSITDDMAGGLNGTLRKALTALIKPKAYYNYSGTSAGTLGKELCNIDEDPNNSSNMYLFYINQSIKKVVSDANTGWNREHCWPQANSGGLYGKTGGGADLLHIRPTLTKTNSKRGNYKYGVSTNSTTLTETYLGKSYQYGKCGSYFEPLDAVKGDAARISFYMYVCYFAERGTSFTNNFQSISLAVEWAKNDAPSDIEKSRNEKAYASVQKNRNPFVDHPEWVAKIFG